MTKRSNPRKDFTQIAFDVVQKATEGTDPIEPIDEKKKAAIESERLGGIKCVKTHANKTST